MTTQQVTLRYSGQGVDILGLVLIGSILNFITFGLYFPWMINSIIKYVCRHAHVADHVGSESVRVEFTGSGSDLFGRFVLWMILTVVTFGLYAPWAVNGIYAYVVEHIKVHVAADSSGSQDSGTSVPLVSETPDEVPVTEAGRGTIVRSIQRQPLRAAAISFAGAVFLFFVLNFLLVRVLDFLPGFISGFYYDTVYFAFYYPLPQIFEWISYLLGLLAAGLIIFALQQLRRNR